MNISEENFNLICHSASRLASFFRELMHQPQFEQKARSMYPNIVKKDDDYYLLFFDLIKCYKGLGHDMDLNANESLGLVLVVSKTFDRTSSFSMLGLILETIRPAYTSLVNSVSEQLTILPKDYDFLIANVLSGMGEKDLRKQYYVLLFRFCSLVSKTDGKISEAESRWLADLLKVSEGKAESLSFSVETSQRTSYTSISGSNKQDITTRTEEFLPIQEKMKASDAIKELDSLTGLSSVKEQVHSLMNYTMVQMMRQSRGMKKIPISLHCVFSGNPGTGKTTVARLMGRIYKDLGLISNGRLVETDRSGLVAEYLGQTAKKTNEVIDSAIGGVLFIDEAYSLVSGSKEDYGREAISTLLKRMEDQRDDLVVILAGYTENMETFLSSNPGLKSRFNRTILFEDYSSEDLLEIYSKMLSSYDYKITDEAKALVRSRIENAVLNKDKDFGNGRFARNLFEKTLESQACRVAFLPNVNEDILNTIIPEDVKGL